MRLRAASLALLAASGCGSGAEPRSTPGSPSPTSAIQAGTLDSTSLTPAAPVRRAEARRAVRRAADLMLTEPVTPFVAVTSAEDVTLVETEGSATLEGWRATTRFTYPAEDGDSTMRVVSRGTTTWIQMVGWPEPARGCWLELGPRQVPLGITAMVPGTPAYVSLLDFLRADGSSADGRGVVEGSLPLRAAMALVDGRALQRMGVSGIDPAGQHVPVRISYGGGRVLQVTVTGDDLSESLRRAGTSGGLEVRELLEAVTYTLRFPVPRSDDEEVRAPDPGLRFDAGEEPFGCR
ncbi:hypothetical protein [Nocardioides litoris]|uniref:hypothetical protein n=1 Tax=Nocardioides litoris TaxID=1926648 RepID=UPI00111D0AD1|nr:hypothetical protein [Nocardioides litoris]